MPCRLGDLDGIVHSLSSVDCFCLQRSDSQGSRNGQATSLAVSDGTLSKAQGRVVTIDYETREGSAKPGKDFKFTQGTLVSQSKHPTRL